MTPDDAHPPSLVGMTLSGRYRILRQLGEGAMGAVYEAEHVHMRKRLAVKVLHAEMSRLPEIVLRFEREAMAAGNIDHPNVVAASDFGKLDDGSFFLVLEYVVGQSLREALAGGRFDVGRALYITRQMASALGSAHARNIVHRDLKPENVMLVERNGDANFVKVLDFGIAKVPVHELSPEGTPSGQKALTQMGMIFGTPDYMAPEQALGQAVDARADLYSVGIVAFEMLTGVRPFEHENNAMLLTMHVTAPVPSMASVAPDADVPSAVEAIVRRLLAKDPAQRFSSAAELVATIAVTTADLAARGKIDARWIDPGASGSSPASVAALRPEPALRPLLAAAVSTLRPALVRATGSARSWAGTRRGRTSLAGVGAVLAIGLVWATVSGGRSAARQDTASDSGTAAVAHDRGLVDPLAVAEGLLDKGDFPGAIAELSPLELAHPDAGVIHRDLERARMGNNDVSGALHEARAWMAIDPTALHDPKLAEDVRSAALGTRDPDDAFELLTTSLDAAGADILYDIAYGPTQTATGERARKALADPAVRKYASPSLSVTLDIRAARSCDAKKALFDRARQVGDGRTLAVLRPYKVTSGCGFFSRRDCWPCMHRDGSLADVMVAIEARVGVGAP